MDRLPAIWGTVAISHRRIVNKNNILSADKKLFLLISIDQVSPGIIRRVRIVELDLTLLEAHCALLRVEVAEVDAIDTLKIGLGRLKITISSAVVKISRELGYSLRSHEFQAFGNIANLLK